MVDVHPEKYLKKLDDALAEDKSLWTRIGTGEHTDSLALDWLTEYSKVFVPYFKDKPVYFELKTKSDEIENLLELNHGGRTVVAWSLNPSCYESEESKTAPLARRLEAARRVQAAGYPVAFHFDPIFYDENWEGKYEELVHQVYDTLIDPPKWLSLGMFRYHRDLKKVSEFRHPETRIFLGE